MQGEELIAVTNLCKFQTLKERLMLKSHFVFPCRSLLGFLSKLSSHCPGG